VTGTTTLPVLMLNKVKNIQEFSVMAAKVLYVDTGTSAWYALTTIYAVFASRRAFTQATIWSE